MKIGVGLPNAIAEATGSLILDWARKAETLGFYGVSTVDRIAFPSHDSLATLAAVAGATARIGLFTNVLLAPTRNAILLAKEAATVDQLSGGRLVLGLGVGAREEDFTVSGADFSTRGSRFDTALELVHRVWRGEPSPGSEERISPIPVNGERVPIMIGGVIDKAIARTVRWGIGWTGGGPVYPSLTELVDISARLRVAWRNAGNRGKPRIAALVMYALGPKADERMQTHVAHYYGFAPWGKDIWRELARTPRSVREKLERYRDAGVDELYFDPTIPNLDQLERLAETVLD